MIEVVLRKVLRSDSQSYFLYYATTLPAILPAGSWVARGDYANTIKSYHSNEKELTVELGISEFPEQQGKMQMVLGNMLSDGWKERPY